MTTHVQRRALLAAALGFMQLDRWNEPKPRAPLEPVEDRHDGRQSADPEGGLPHTPLLDGMFPDGSCLAETAAGKLTRDQ